MYIVNKDMMNKMYMWTIKKEKKKKYNPISGIIISIINILWEIAYGDIVNAFIISFHSLSYTHKEREEEEEGEREGEKKNHYHKNIPVWVKTFHTTIS